MSMEHTLLFAERTQGILVPNPATLENVYLNQVSWILVIEKEVRRFSTSLN